MLAQPTVVVLGFLVIGLLGGAIYVVWLSAEEAKAERRKFQRIAEAGQPKAWTPPCFSQKAAKGGEWQRRRI